MTHVKLMLVACFALWTHVPAQNTVHLDRLLSSLQKVVGYYRTNHNKMNFDGIYGLRVLEGQLAVILFRISKKELPLPDTASHYSHWDALVSRLSDIYQEAHNISQYAVQSLQVNEASNYNLLRPLVASPMVFSKPYDQINHDLLWKVESHKAEFTEAFSDQCMSEVMGNPSEQRAPCTISKVCLQNMLMPGMKGYGLTHQLLYTILAEQHGCLSVLNAHLKSTDPSANVSGYRAMLCANSFHEVAKAVQTVHGNIVPRLQDLFMEEEFVCPLLGYMEFLHDDWLRQILSWQHPSGCYGVMPRSAIMENKQDTDYDYQDTDQANGNNKLEGHQRAVVQQDADKLVLYSNNMNKSASMAATGTTRPDVRLIKLDKPSKRGFNVPKNSFEPLQRAVFQQKKDRTIDMLDVRPKQSPADNKGSHWTRRKLLEEKRLRDGCLSHKTAVAIAALSQYMRFMMDPGDAVYRSRVSLSGVNQLMSAKVPDEVHQAANDFVIKKSGLKKPVDNLGQPEVAKHQKGVKNDAFVVPQHPGKIGNEVPNHADEEEEEEEEEDEEEGPEADENHPDDYYDGGEIDPQQRAKRRSEHNFVANDLELQDQGHKFQGLRAQMEEGDKEYEQYIDDEDEEQQGDEEDEEYAHQPRDEVVPKLSKNHIVPARNEHVKSVLERKEDEEDQAYTYYDEELDEDPPKPPQTHSKTRSNQISAGTASDAAVAKPVHMAEIVDSPSPYLSLEASYIIVCIVMFILMVLMYRCIKSRRIPIRYRHR